MKILIPTYRTYEEIRELLEELSGYSQGYDVYPSCIKASASVNRNVCLHQVSVGDVAIMLDDDIRGFYDGWVDDLLFSIRQDPEVVMVSARLLKRDGAFGPTCSGSRQPRPEEIVVSRDRVTTLPTAAIAFVHKGHYFDENFRGSGWEDNDWCLKYRKESASYKFIQSNRCKLVHLNEMKEQKGENWHWNKAHFDSVWKELPR